MAMCSYAIEEWPPFLVVVDVGHVIELYADFSRQGKNYAQFPERNAFRIGMEDLRSADVRERLKRVWSDPFSLDPAKHAAEVTQDIAALLAEMTKTMERRAPADDSVGRGEWAFASPLGAGRGGWDRRCARARNGSDAVSKATPSGG
jgi:hypothetical protein